VAKLAFDLPAVGAMLRMFLLPLIESERIGERPPGHWPAGGPWT